MGLARHTNKYIISVRRVTRLLKEMKRERLNGPRGGGLLEPVWPSQALLGCG